MTGTDTNVNQKQKHTLRLCIHPKWLQQCFDRSERNFEKTVGSARWMQLQDQFRRCLTSIEEIPDEYREASTSGCGLWDDVSGGWLPTNGVLRAPKEELEYMHAWRDAGASAKHCCVTCQGEGKMFHLLCMWNRISRKAVLQRRMGQRPEGGMRSRANTSTKRKTARYCN